MAIPTTMCGLRFPSTSLRGARMPRPVFGMKGQARHDKGFAVPDPGESGASHQARWTDATLQLEVRQGGQRAALFELSRFLQLKQVEADGKPVEFIHNQALEGTELSREGNDLVAVIFPRPLRTGQKMTLHFVYGGEVLSDAGQACCMLVPAGPGIRIVVWTCRNSICDSATP